MSFITARPSCEKCGRGMRFQRIDPGQRGFENQVFECGRCYTMKAVSVSKIHNPTTLLGWVEIPLRAPK